MRPRHLAPVFLLISIATCGCALGPWSVPDFMLTPGSAVFFTISRQERSGSRHSWKRGGSTPTTEVLATRFRAIDIRTCQIVRTAIVRGRAHVLAWDQDGDDLWLVNGELSSRIQGFRADPASDTIMINSSGRLLAYRPSLGRIDACDGD